MLLTLQPALLPKHTVYLVFFFFFVLLGAHLLRSLAGQGASNPPISVSPAQVPAMPFDMGAGDHI